MNAIALHALIQAAAQGTGLEILPPPPSGGACCLATVGKLLLTFTI